MLPNLQDVFDLPFHMARDQIEESLRTKMSSIKVFSFISLLCWSIDQRLCQQMKILISDKSQNLRLRVDLNYAIILIFRFIK